MTPTEQQAVKWACRFVGWREETIPEVTSLGLHYYIVPELEDVGPVYRTDADLAEAVRVKCNSEEGRVIFDAETGDWGYCLAQWGEHGPLAFIVAVMEVVDP